MKPSTGQLFLFLAVALMHLTSAAALLPAPYRYAALGDSFKSGPVLNGGDAFLLQAGDAVHVMDMDTFQPIKSVAIEFWAYQFQYQYLPATNDVILVDRPTSFLWDLDTGAITEFAHEVPLFSILNARRAVQDENKSPYSYPGMTRVSHPSSVASQYALVESDSVGLRSVAMLDARGNQAVVLNNASGEVEHYLNFENPDFQECVLYISANGNMAGVKSSNIASCDYQIFFWSLPSGTPLQSYCGTNIESPQGFAANQPGDSEALFLVLNDYPPTKIFLIRPGVSTVVKASTVLSDSEVYSADWVESRNALLFTANDYSFNGSTTRLVNADTGEVIKETFGNSNSNYLALNDADSRLFLSDESGRVSVWGSNLEALTRFVPAVDEELLPFEFPLYVNRAGNVAAVGTGIDGVVYDVGSGKAICQASGFYPFGISPDGSLVLAYGDDAPQIWDSSNCTFIGEGVPGSVFTGGGNRDVMTFTDDHLTVGALGEAPRVDFPVDAPVPAQPGEPYLLWFSRGGEWFLATSNGTDYAVGSTVTGAHHWVSKADQYSPYRPYQLSPDGNYILDSGRDSVWWAETGENVPTGAYITDEISFSSDGDWIYSGSRGIGVWPFSVRACAEACGGAKEDSDGDGLTDCVEEKFGTSPIHPDSDADGAEDGYEVLHCSEPRIQASRADAACYAGRTAGEISGIADAVSHSFHEWDGDGNGLLSLSELVSAQGENASATMAALDLNNDGQLRLSEAQALSTVRQWHSADANGSGRIDFGELLRVVQIYNAGSYGCASGPGATEDGFVPGGGSVPCLWHSADYLPGDGEILLSELIRVIQLFNTGAYQSCTGASADGFCAAS